MMSRWPILGALSLVLLARSSRAQNRGRPLVEVTSLKVLLEKGIITPREYAAAERDIGESAGTKGATDPNTLVIGKFATTLYGFVETDAIHDSTESYAEVAGSGLVQRNETFAGQHGRLQGSVRNSRLGLRIDAPAFATIRVSGQLEMDFLGNEPAQAYPPTNGAITEASLYANPAFRARHLNVKVETPIVDFLVGQYWALFGWQPYFDPNTVEIQGVPGELYSRRPQIRVSKTFRTSPIDVDVAIAALDPVQRDSEAPEMQAGVRIVFNNWRGKHTAGATGTQISPASLGISGDMKYVKVPVFAASPMNTTDLVGSSLAFDAFVPIVPVRDGGRHGNDLSLLAEAATGYGIADQYTSFTGGVTFPAAPAGYAQNIDNGIVTFDAAGQLHYVQWYVGIVGLQYYLPIRDGKIWLAVQASRAQSPNAAQFGVWSKVLSSISWVNGDFFAEPAPGVRVGLSFSRTYDNYGDGQQAINDRVQGSAFFVF